MEEMKINLLGFTPIAEARGTLLASPVGKKFGGNKRRVFTTTNEKLRDQRATVREIKIFKSGDRVAGYNGYDYHDGYCSEPPFLEEQKTHKVLSLDRILIDHKMPTGFTALQEMIDIQIEACYVTKIYSVEEIESVCGIIGLLDDRSDYDK